MKHPATILRRPLQSGALFFLIITLATAALAQSDLADALRKCAAVESDAARLTCFDAIANPLVKAESQTSEPGEATELVDGNQPKPLSDDVGKGAVAGEEAPRIIYTATVTRCEHNRRLNEFLFFLENGQIWKMSNFRRPIVVKCSFDVTIEQDFFGFKMDIPSENASFRVSRVH